ncbi:MAG: DUF6132 family protein [Armatimonadota bacterium]
MGSNIILKIIAGAVIGGVCGFLFYRFVGCSTGACPITSNPVISIIYGAVIGGLIAGMR